MRIAIVGAGIAGLTAARALHRRHEVVLFERNAYLGGHTHTIDDAASGLALDTGFIVYNERTYPEFTKLLRELDVGTQPSEMSFSVRCGRCGLEYAGHSVRSLLAGGWRAFTPSFGRMLADILRFNRWAARTLLAGPGALPCGTLGEVVVPRYSRGFLRHYLAPMTSAIWSGTVADAEAMPVEFLLEFFRNHGLLQVSGQPPWRTVAGGSRRYVEALVAPFADRIRTRCAVRSIARHAAGVDVTLDDGSGLRVDRVVIAAHADEALALLVDPDEDERRLLGAMPYRVNRATLHTDDRVLPRSRAAWASWNYHVPDCDDGDAPLQMTYYLNRLQRLAGDIAYCVTLNDDGRIRRDRVLAQLEYAHPVYTPEGLSARRQISRINGRRRTHYCGAYIGFGFHEDGVRAALDVVDQLEAQGTGT